MLDYVKMTINLMIVFLLLSIQPAQNIIAAISPVVEADKEAMHCLDLCRDIDIEVDCCSDGNTDFPQNDCNHTCCKIITGQTVYLGENSSIIIPFEVGILNPYEKQLSLKEYNRAIYRPPIDS